MYKEREREREELTATIILFCNCLYNILKSDYLQYVTMYTLLHLFAWGYESYPLLKANGRPIE